MGTPPLAIRVSMARVVGGDRLVVRQAPRGGSRTGDAADRMRAGRKRLAIGFPYRRKRFRVEMPLIPVRCGRARRSAISPGQ